MAKHDKIMSEIVALCKRRGFIFQSSEIYGGLNACWDFGPLGVEMKNNIKRAWWRSMVQLRQDVEGLDAAILMHPRVWEASGHIGGFVDMMRSCKYCKRLLREDQVWPMIEESKWYNSLMDMYRRGAAVTGVELKHWGETKAKKLAPNLAIARNPSVTISWLAERLERVTDLAETNMHELVQYLATEQLLQTGLVTPCPYCGGDLADSRPFNLMFKTNMGAVENEENTVYLRPETAQGIYVNYQNVMVTMRQRPPFGIAQIGKAFRNEISPGNFIFRSREFEQMEMQFFVNPKEADKWFEYWREQRWNWYLEMGFSPEKIHWHQHGAGELAHYAKAAFDVEFDFPFGTKELEGVHNRGDFDLTRHQQYSGKNLEYNDTVGNEKYIPFIIETSGGVDRCALAVLCDAYTVEPERGSVVSTPLNDQSSRSLSGVEGNAPKTEMRTVLKMHPKLSPIKAGVFPLVKKDGMPEVAMEICTELRKSFMVFYDEKDSIGRRYRRMDEAGTPFCVTVDGQTLQDKTVTIRERDTMVQVRVKIDEIAKMIEEYTENWKRDGGI